MARFALARFESLPRTTRFAALAALGVALVLFGAFAARVSLDVLPRWLPRRPPVVQLPPAERAAIEARIAQRLAEAGDDLVAVPSGIAVPEGMGGELVASPMPAITVRADGTLDDHGPVDAAELSARLSVVLSNDAILHHRPARFGVWVEGALTAEQLRALLGDLRESAWVLAVQPSSATPPAACPPDVRALCARAEHGDLAANAELVAALQPRVLTCQDLDVLFASTRSADVAARRSIFAREMPDVLRGCASGSVDLVALERLVAAMFEAPVIRSRPLAELAPDARVREALR